MWQNAKTDPGFVEKRHGFELLVSLDPPFYWRLCTPCRQRARRQFGGCRHAHTQVCQGRKTTLSSEYIDILPVCPESFCVVHCGDVFCGLFTHPADLYSGGCIFYALCYFVGCRSPSPCSWNFSNFKNTEELLCVFISLKPVSELKIYEKNSDTLQIQLSEKINFSRSCIGKVEVGIRMPSMNFPVEVSDLAGATLDYLIVGKKKKSKTRTTSTL